MNDEFMEEYARIAEVFRTCCTNYGVEDRPSCDECPYSDLIIKTLASDGEVMFSDYTECETALCTRVYEMMDELILALGHARQIEKRSNEIISELGDKVRRAADVVPVRHGTWKNADEQPYFRKHYHAKVCSECGKRKDGKWLYCPYCGSKNQGGGKDNG